MDITTIKQLIEDGKIEYIKIGASDIEGVFRGKRVAARFF
jgi:glutamine synthetase